MTYEKIFALLAAFSLGCIVSFFVTIKSIGFMICGSARTRRRWRSIIEQAEREAQ